MSVDTTKVAFSSEIGIDKILGVYSGSFTMASPGAAFTNAYGEIDTGAALTSKVFTQMIWSDDSGVTWQDGDARTDNYSGGSLQYYYLITSYATASKIFVVYNNNGLNSNAPARAIQYKVFSFSMS